MENYGKKRSKTLYSFFKPRGETSRGDTPPSNVKVEQPTPNEVESPKSRTQRTGVDYNFLERDPNLHISIQEYPVNLRDEGRRAYIKMGHYQQKLVEYSRTPFGKQYRRFKYGWFENSPWLEYSPSKDVAFCFPCYLFESDIAPHCTLTNEGFTN
ncbi:hypothetical protein Sjap_013014 [Stephania japonica]|uniref:TTF-type domain-containing protein n=1 Tax=Stephania japonica TaxID=461633 RepID=A0AAP0NXB2_9MAGN